MMVTVVTYFGEKITIRNTTKEEANKILLAHGVPDDWIYSLEVKD